MKKSLSYSALLAGTAFSLFSCQKVNSIQEDIIDKKKSNKDFCLISSFSYSNSAVPTQTIFTNHFDLAGRSLEVEAGIFSGGSVLSRKNFEVKWAGNEISFADAAAPQNIILVASFNNRGRIDKIIPGNSPMSDFLPTSFEYNGNRLSAMHITLGGTTTTSQFNYDHKGNLINISDLPTTSVPIPGKVEYRYSNEKAEGQFYFDEPRGFSWNSFSLLQYVGLFPELQPVNLRISTKVNWGMNYQAYNMDIKNHQLDHKGKLISYDIASPGSETTISHYNINWSCNNSALVQTPDNN